MPVLPGSGAHQHSGVGSSGSAAGAHESAWDHMGLLETAWGLHGAAWGHTLAWDNMGK